MPWYVSIEIKEIIHKLLVYVIKYYLTEAVDLETSSGHIIFYDSSLNHLLLLVIEIGTFALFIHVNWSTK